MLNVSILANRMQKNSNHDMRVLYSPKSQKQQAREKDSQTTLNQTN